MFCLYLQWIIRKGWIKRKANKLRTGKNFLWHSTADATKIMRIRYISSLILIGVLSPIVLCLLKTSFSYCNIERKNEINLPWISIGKFPLCWLAGWQTDWMNEWLTKCLFSRLIDWLTDWLIFCLGNKPT